ncbi:MAG: hypothetical protein WC292_01085 [Clostridia bacterium]
MTERNLKDFFNELQLEDDFFTKTLDYIAAGKTELQQSRVVETMVVDDAWIRTIESLIYSVERIVKDPKKFIIDERIIVNVEKAKKTDAETIRHLASHTNYIRAIGDDGFIQPSKLQVKEINEDLLIYENRFVFSLIERLTTFIEQRYTAIKEQIDTYDTTNLKLKSKFNIHRGEVEYDINIKVRNETANRIMLQKNHDLLGKIEVLRKRILILRGTQFYKALSKAKPVYPPIMKTNIINMQKDYQAAYQLWMFISSYNTIGFSVDVSDKRMPIDTEYYDDLAMLVALGIKTMVNNNSIRETLYKKTPFRRRPKKRYREIRRIDYEPSFRGVAGLDNKEAVNQFYFDKIKEIIEEQERLRTNDRINMVTIRKTFQNVFRILTNFSNEIFNDILGVSRYPEPIRKLTSLQKKQHAYRKQDELYRKYVILSRLKAAELSKTLSRENTQKIKLERLRFNYELALEKEGQKKKKPKKKTISVADREKRLADLYAKAERDESVRMAKEIKRQETILAKERERLENLKKAREEQRKIREIAKQILSQQEDKWED